MSLYVMFMQTDAVSQLVRELCAVAFGFVKCFLFFCFFKKSCRMRSNVIVVALDGGTLFKFSEFNTELLPTKDPLKTINWRI